VIALDTNILVYAHRAENKFYPAARELVERLAEGRNAWAIPWSCIHEFYSAVTNRRIFAVPSPKEAAIAQVKAWLGSPRLVLLHEGSDHWNLLREFIDAGQITGPMVHDARIAAICVTHGVSELWSADRDFNRFPQLNVRNPLIG